MYYFHQPNYCAGDPKNDIKSVALILMAQEMGIKDYEEKMKKKDQRQHVMEAFVQGSQYSKQVRKLIW